MIRATKLVALAVVCAVCVGEGCSSSADDTPYVPAVATGGASGGGTGGAGPTAGSGGASVEEDAGGVDANATGGSSGNHSAPGGGTGGGAADDTGATGGSGGNHSAPGGGGASGGTGGDSATGGTGGSSSSSAASGTIVPLYTYPSDPTWARIIDVKQAHPQVTIRAIINPDSGPGPSRNPSYVTGVANLHAAGIVVLAYVTTSYASKSASAVHAEIDTYHDWYPGLDGVFFDEMSSTPGDEAYYSGLTQYVKGLGYTVTVGNPGTDTAPGYVGTVDTLLIYESDGEPSSSTLEGWHDNYDKSNFGIIPYAVPSFDAAFVQTARPQVGFIYVTNDDLPNPWDSLPPYFEDLVAALD